MSRQRVNRIIKKCLETGIVTISIRENLNTNVELEAQMEERTGLNEVVISSSDMKELNESLGAAASVYLERILKDNDIIGFSRGRALSHLVSNLTPINKKNLTVTQLVGGLNAQETSTNSDNIVRDSALILNAKPCFMYAPIIVENKQLRDSMLSQSFFSQVYDTMKKCTVAVVGIGNFTNQTGLVPKSFMFEDEYKDLQKKNAIGEICTYYFNADGTIIESGINERVFAIDYESYIKIPIRVGIAGGDEKTQAIIGAIKGRLINVLITDLDTANEVRKAF
ncbi:MAG: sugar-binding domain-containing protein [Eubacteriales bacterium]|nr:sugar-binding domain-containing protein [Eubacteriales bacterium]